MDNHHALSMLSKSLDFKNLTAASQHVGLSQPQLSRLISQLEREFEIELLDRRVKRKASWTPQAYKLAELYEHNQRKFTESIRSLQHEYLPREIHIGCLEGLFELAVQKATGLLERTSVVVLTLDVFDRNELEAKYLAGDLDVILNSRVPGLQLPKFIKTCGFQSLTREKKEGDFQIYSQFEFQARRKKIDQKIMRSTDVKKTAKNKEKFLVSNSLAVRRGFFEWNGGQAVFPSSIHADFREGDEEVLLVGAANLDQRLWDCLRED